MRSGISSSSSSLSVLTLSLRLLRGRSSSSSLLRLMLLARPLLGFFSPEAEVIDYGVRFIHIVTPFYLAICFNQIYAGALRGVGDAVRPVVIIGIGICLAMIPLIGYNYASGNHRRMSEFFTAARIAGLAIAAVSVLLYYLFADRLINAFIADAETVRLGTAFLRARCFATPFMFLSFNMVNFMQAVNRGRESFLLAAIRQIGLECVSKRKS